MDLQAEHGTSVLLITHDLGVVAQTCQQVAVMYNGELQETAPVDRLFADPQADYTRKLLSFLPAGRDRVISSFGSLTHPASSAATQVSVVEALATQATPQGASDAKPALLEVKGLTKVFPGRRTRGQRHPEPIKAV